MNVARSYYAALTRTLDAYSVQGGPIESAPVHQALFSVLSFRDGKVARVKDHVDHAAALEAVGLPAS